MTTTTADVLADLAGGAEIAQELGVSRGLVAVWQGRYDDFPQPLVVLAAGKFYSLTEVRRWHAARFGA